MAYTVLPAGTINMPVGTAEYNAILASLAAVYNPPSALSQLNLGADLTTTSTSFVDADATNLKLTITFDAAADVLFGFFATVKFTVGGIVFFDVTMDGVRIGGDDGFISGSTDSHDVVRTPISFVGCKLSVAAGAHEFRLQWKVNAGTTATLYAGAGTGTGDLHPQFWVRKV